MPVLGRLTLALALAVGVYSIGANVIGARRGRLELLISARHALWAMCAMITVAVASLWVGLLRSDFSLEYVASYSSTTLPTIYKITSLWGGQQGSLLFWTWLLSIFTALVAIQNRRRNPEIAPYALAVMAGVAVFFLGMLNFVTRPFDLLAVAPLEGSDLNPLLQNYWMAIHPPSLYTGYVSATVPFAFGAAALITGKLDDDWIRSTRRWAIFSWFFLTLGNIFGARWAYEVLGWGGYWAWDPVENAAFMPWLVMTAYLHSVMIQERKDMLKVWNLVLVGLAFLLTLFGTFITRSGVISSVHSFTQSGLGPYFLTFLIVVTVAYTVLLISRVRMLQEPGRVRVISLARGGVPVQQPGAGGNRVRDLLGHDLPGAVGGGARRQDHGRAAVLQQGQRAARAGADFPDGGGTADRLAQSHPREPGEKLRGARVGRRGDRAGVLLRRRDAAMVRALGDVAGGVRAGHSGGRGSRAAIDARRHLVGESPPRALVNLVAKNNRRYGGYIIHVGVVAAFVGIVASSFFKAEVKQSVHQGESFRIGNYELKYLGLESSDTPHLASAVARLDVFDRGRWVATMEPAKLFFKQPQQPATKVAIRSSPRADLYVVLAGIDEASGLVTFDVFLTPLVFWLWAGGLLMAVGTVVVMWPNVRERAAIAAAVRRATEDEFAGQAVSPGD